MSSASSLPAHGPVQEAIHQKLEKEFAPIHLEVINESFMHNVPKGSESHFKVVIASAAFDSMKLLERHRAVNALLEQELRTKVHALSIVAKTTKQWAKKKVVEPSPKCLGGSKAGMGFE
jgi:BolA protein